ncbi:MAG TPA: GW dipeptide domain-containing protein [Bdellovibrionales bacterium]|nr:GW dipeptide domain-containing protein [Bdellovibrionales bacterium]
MLLLTLILSNFSPVYILADDQNHTTNQTYNEAIALFQQGKFEEAKAKFEQSVQTQGPNPYLLYNLALTELKLGRVGPALGLWRKALDLDPGFGRARDAIEHTNEKMKIKELPHKITATETLRKKLLSHFSLSDFLLLTALSLASAGWLGLSYFGRRFRAKKGEDRAPAFPGIALLLSLSFVAFATLTVLKAVDENQTRATVIAPKIEARAGPGAEQASLFELFEGMEVIVRESLKTDDEKQWVQVTYPGGMTGWIPAETMMISSGAGTW